MSPPELISSYTGLLKVKHILITVKIQLDIAVQ